MAAVAASIISSTRGSSDGEKSSRRKSTGSTDLGGRPTPMRTRTKSELPSCSIMDFIPKWPPDEPPMRILSSPKSRSMSSYTMTMFETSTWHRPAALAEDSPDAFMNVAGSNIPTYLESIRPAQNRPLKASRNEAPLCSAKRRSPVMNPRLCRLRVYSEPGFPRNIRSCSIRSDSIFRARHRRGRPANNSFIKDSNPKALPLVQ